MASAYHGIADDGSAVYYNPTGLALIENGEMNVEGYAYVIFSKFRYEMTTPAGTAKHESTEKVVVPGGASLSVRRLFRHFRRGGGVRRPQP